MVYVCRDLPSEWGLSVLELPYGHMALQAELWTGRQGVGVRAAYLQVFNLRIHLPATFSVMRAFALKAFRTFTSKRRIDQHAEANMKRRFDRAEKVMVLVPTQENKLFLHWAGGCSRECAECDLQHLQFDTLLCTILLSIMCCLVSYQLAAVTCFHSHDYGPLSTFYTDSHCLNYTS